MLCMASASSFANVWSEYVYKKDDNDDFYMKNVQLYLYGVVFNCMLCHNANNFSFTLSLIIKDFLVFSFSRF